MTGLLATMSMEDVYDFIFVMMKEIQEEKLWEYYLNKSTFSEMSYSEFREEQEFSQSQTYTPTDVVEKTRKYADAIIEILPPEEVSE